MLNFDASLKRSASYKHIHIQKVANYAIIEQRSASIAVTVITDQSNYTIGRFL